MSRFAAEIILTFEAHILALVLVGGLIAIAATQPILLFVGLCLVLIGAFLLVSFVMDNRLTTDNKTYRVLSLNVFRENKEFVAVASAIQKEQPDVFALVEYTSEWHREFTNTQIANEYPFCQYHFFAHGQHEDGIAVYSKVAFTVEEKSPDGSFLVCTSEDFNFIVTHLDNPIVSHDSFVRRNEQMDAVARIVRRAELQQTPFCVFGDFNTTPYSLEFRSLLKKSGLKRAGLRKYLPSWTPLVRWWANIGGLPLDHFLHNDYIIVEEIHIGSFVSSDHRPIIADFGILR